jgi:hypothetical protein
MRSRAISLLSLGLIWLLLIGPNGHAQDSPPSEYQIKAAFLFNFVKFVEWPPAAFSGGASPIVIGILGQNPFHDDLSQMVRSKTVDGRPLEVRQLHSLADAANCHMLFISASERSRLPEIINSLKGTTVLTVGDTDHFTENGGMINLVLKSDKVRFEINKNAATSAGLKISSKLMSLALRPGD